MSGKKEMYSPEENKKLSELVKKYEAAVLNPSTTKASNDSKNKAWERITEEFNETNEIMVGFTAFCNFNYIIYFRMLHKKI